MAFNSISTPFEIRQNIFFLLPIQDLFTLPRVCKQFNSDLTDEFYQKKCYEIFESLKSLPLFIDPIIKAVRHPWKLICFSLAGLKKNKEFYPVAEFVARKFFQQFNDYLLDDVNSKKLEKLNHESKMQLICGSGYQDPKSQIDQAWKSFEKNWSDNEEKELEELKAIFAQNEELAAFSRDLNSIVVSKLSLRSASNASPYNSTFFEAFVKALEEGNKDQRIVKFAKLLIKKTKSYQSYQQLESERHTLNLEIMKIDYRISGFNKITQNSSGCQKYSAEIVYHILYLLPYMRKWEHQISSLPRLQKAINELTTSPQSPERILGIKNRINYLPKDVSTYIWRTLYERCANNSQEDQWSENHFHEHPVELENIISKYFYSDSSNLLSLLKYGDFNTNPFQNSRFLQTFAKSNQNIGFQYPLV